MTGCEPPEPPAPAVAPLPHGGLVVDARGTRCPVPVLRLARAVRDLPAGSLATVLASDPAVEHDVPAWAGMRGHTVEELGRSEDGWVIRVRTGAVRTTG